MTPTKSPSERHLDIDELDRAIVTLSARINAASYELLVLIRRSDERAGWLQWGFANCAEWLHWRCDLSLSAAREKVRVAHALKTLPVISLSFFRGKLSYSKVRALTRVARSDNEDSLMAFALKTTAARVEERCRELRCGTVDSVTEANRAHARRSLRIHRDPLRGTLTITVELPLEAGELIDKALDKARSSPRSPGRRTISSTGQPGVRPVSPICCCCAPRHHRLVHEGGFSIAKDYLDRWYFRRPDGIAVPHCGYRPEDTQDDDIDTHGVLPELNPSAEGHSISEGLPTIPPNVADRGPIAEGLPTLPLIVAERDPPAYLM